MYNKIIIKYPISPLMCC